MGVTPHDNDVAPDLNGNFAHFLVIASAVFADLKYRKSAHALGLAALSVAGGGLIGFAFLHGFLFRLSDPHGGGERRHVLPPLQAQRS